MYCSHCGVQITEETKFCPSCGAGNQATQRVTQPSQQPVVVNVVNTNTNTNTNGFDTAYGPLKSRWAAFFMCFFFGYLGVHKFYVGKTGSGILYLLTFGLFGIGWLIDTIVLLIGGSRDKWGRKLA